MSVRSNRTSRASSGHCSLTAKLVRDAVKELEKRRQRVPLSLLLTHFQQRLPVQRNVELLKHEIIEQATKAVKLGYLRQFADGSYCLSTLRWQATAEEFGWD
ncbi:uncharacterized protein LOC107980885 [Nasonia vitripennis]|uniref:Uncharacterized protein n=1 Tax=Nasonia vitripennis TaxID=7425 RepID=A0A7M7M6Q7_NASVI|nr:uncharacterized protein LOC107980885 [Nasonia vitripennis]